MTDAQDNRFPGDIAALLPLLLDAVPDYVALLDAAGVITYINRSIMPGIPAPGLRGFSIFSTLRGESIDRARAALAECLANGRVQEAELETEVDGRPRWFLSRFVPLPQDAGRRVLSVSTEVTAYHDITGRMGETARRLEAHIHNTPLAFMAFGADWRVTDWNPAAERMFGWGRAEALGKTAEQLMVRSEDIPRFREEIALVERGQGKPVLSFTNRHRDGRLIITRCFVTPLRDATGAVNGSDVLIEDITEQRQLLDRLSLSQQMLDSHIHNTPLAALTWDSQFRVLSWNKAAERLYGWTAEEAIGKSFREIIVPPEDQAEAEHAFRRQFDTGDTNNLVTEVVRKDGSRLVCHSFNTPIRDASGKVVVLASLVDDVTEHEQLLHALEASQRQLIDQLHNTPLAAIVWDPQFRVREWNKAAEKLYGYSREEAIGRFGPELLLQGPEREAAIELSSHSFQTGDVPARDVYHAWTRDGRKIHTENFNTPIRDAAGRIVAISTLARDITADLQLQDALQRAKAEAEQTARVKSEFLANMSHEIRTPMHGIIGAIDLLAQEPCSDSVRDYLRIIESSAQSLLSVINNVLDLSKIEAGALRIEVQPFDVQATVSSAVEALKPLAIKKGLQLSVGCVPGLSGHYLGDALRIRQIVTNLVGNAIKFTDSGSVAVECEERPGGEDRRVVLVRVRDTGIGIDAEKSREIFQDFSQADGSISREYGGTGLGLSISLRLARLMGGDIAVRSAPGKGSEFTLALPLLPATGIPPADSEPAAPAQYPYAALIVDDNPVNLAIGSRMLESLGMTVVSASTGAEAVVRFAQGRFDVVFMDLQMPVMDGFEAARKIRVLQEVPIVAMTANVLERDNRDCLAAGMIGYIGKPFQKKDLVRVLDEILGR